MELVGKRSKPPDCGSGNRGFESRQAPHLRHHRKKGRRCCIRCCVHNENDHCTLLRKWKRGDAPPCSRFQQIPVRYELCVACIGGCACAHVVELADTSVLGTDG